MRKCGYKAVNIAFISSNIPASLAYAVYISQLLRLILLHHIGVNPGVKSEQFM
jgi:hypothetical protein